MSYRFSNQETNSVLRELKKTYRIYAPKRFPKQGRYSDTDIIRYDEINTIEDIVFDEKSDYPAKEIINPIQQTLFYFNEEEYAESKANTKPILLFARPCDICAQHIQEKIYLTNGDIADIYYKRMRERVKFVLMECPKSDDTCFCVSMGTNKTDDYVLAIRHTDDETFIEIKDETFTPFFANGTPCDFKHEVITENETKVTLPVIKDKEVLNALKKHPMWREFDKRCISCGACTVACSTCTCFTTRDIIYTENGKSGERRRVSASCQVEGFDQMAGQREIRSTAGDRMRYKVLHKFHDYKARFKDTDMCVGCGRCIHRCPEFISITHTLDKMNAAIDEINKELGK